MKGGRWGRGGAGASSTGFALPLLLLLLLALTLVAHGTLLLSQREVVSSRAFQRATQARGVSISALPAALVKVEELVGTRALGWGEVLAREELAGGLWRRATVHWLTRELFLLEGEGGMVGWSGVKRRGGVGWMMDPETRLAAFQGGVEVGDVLGITGSGRVVGVGWRDTPVGWAEDDCFPYRSLMDSLFADEILHSTAAFNEEGEGIPSLGLLGGDEILRRIGGPLPEMSGGLEMGCPGSSPSLTWGTEGELILSEGRLCGFLAVEGDLVLEGEGSFQGVVLVGGSLHLRGGWSFQGMGRVRGSVLLSDSASLEVSACAAFRALSAESPLLRPSLLPHASNIPLF